MIFGGTFSGLGVSTRKIKKSGEPEKVEEYSQKVKRSKYNYLFIPQGVANVKNFLGLSRPKIYKQAAEIACTLQEYLGQKSQLSITGHSLGGGMTAYACAKAGVEGRAFSSAALGRKTLNTLSDKEKERAKTLVTHYLVKGDMVNNSWLSNPFKMEFSPTMPGDRVIIKARSEAYPNAPFANHIYSHDCYMDHLKRLPYQNPVSGSIDQELQDKPL